MNKKSQDFETQKSELISGLINVRDKILFLAASLNQAQQSEVFLGSWSSRELLAHLAGWDETNIKAAEEILTDKLPSFYEHSNKDWSNYNEYLVLKYSRDDFWAMVSFVQETHGNLVAFLMDLPAAEFWNDRGIRARGWKVMIGRLLESELEDEKQHYQQLLAFIENGTKS